MNVNKEKKQVNLSNTLIINKLTLQEILICVDKLPLEPSVSNYQKTNLLNQINNLCNTYEEAEKFISSYIDDVPLK